MNRTLVIRPEAEADVDKIRRWYEQQRDGLGADFLLCFEEALEKIRRHPELYPLVHRQVRRGFVRRFPYGVFYVVDDDRIAVVGVFHASRDPRRWQSRG